MVCNEFPEKDFQRTEYNAKHYLNVFLQEHFKEKDSIRTNFDEIEIDMGATMDWEERIEEAREVDPALARFYEIQSDPAFAQIMSMPEDEALAAFMEMMI